MVIKFNSLLLPLKDQFLFQKRKNSCFLTFLN